MSFRERIFGDGDERLAVRLVFALTLFILHDTALLIESRGVDDADEVSHAVGLEEENPVEGEIGTFWK
jgi:hypothetical protein